MKNWAIRLWQEIRRSWRFILLPKRPSQLIRQGVVLGLVGLLLSQAIAACEAPKASPNAKNIELILVGYAVPKAAHDAIIAKFVEKWKQEHNGQTVSFLQSYGASGTQTRAVIEGLDADIVHLAIGADINKLASVGLVSPDWSKRLPNDSVPAETVAAIITRAGNPKGLKTFGDLARDDIKWVTPNPKTSGGARWNYYALFNYAKQTGKDPNQTQAFVTQAFKNVAALTRDARESMDAFAQQGQGDALVNYENEVILARKKGKKLDFVIPDVNISIDTPVAVLDKNVDKHGNREAAEAFAKFLFTPEAQREFAKLGFRPLGSVAQEPEFIQQFPKIKQLIRIQQYGGWEEAQKTFDEGGVFDQIEVAIAQQQ